MVSPTQLMALPNSTIEYPQFAGAVGRVLVGELTARGAAIAPNNMILRICFFMQAITKNRCQ